MTRAAVATLPTQRDHLAGKRLLAQGPREWLKERGERDRTLHVRQAGPSAVGGARLEDRADALAELWLIHGKVYDLGAYMDKHPGAVGREGSGPYVCVHVCVRCCVCVCGVVCVFCKKRKRELKKGREREREK